MRRALAAASLLCLPALAAPARTAHAQSAPTQATQGQSAGAPAATAAYPADQAPPAGQVQETVVTATRVPTLAERVPAGVTVIDRSTIEQNGYVSLVDALSAVPGLRVVQSGGAGGVASVFIRGTNSNHVLVLRDGVPLNDPSVANGAFNFGVDGLADVERIEIIRGPMSGLYGSGAIGGVINLITRRGHGGPVNGGIDIAGGAPQQVNAIGTVGGVKDGFDYSLTIASTSQLGFDITPSRMSVHTGERDGFRQQLATLNVGYTFAPGSRLYATLRGTTAVFGLDNIGGSPTFDGPDYTGRDAELFGHVAGTASLFDGLLTSTISVARIQNNRSYVQLLLPQDPNQASSDDHYNGYRTDVQWNNVVHIPDRGALSAASITFGYEYIGDNATTRLNDVSFGFPYQAGVDASTNSNAGTLGAQATLWKRLTLITALREEATQISGSAFTWRAGAVLAVPEIRSRLHVAYGTAFSAPTLFELYGVDSYGYVGNPNLQPERSEGWEAGWTLDVPMFGRKDAASVEVTYFHNRISNLIETQFQPVYTSVNVSSALASGIETSITLRPARWLDAEIDYTYTDARDLATNTQLLRRPYNSASGTLHIRPVPGMVIAPQLQFTGSFMDSLIDNAGYYAGTGRSGGALIVNLSASYAVTPRITLYANGYNLANTAFEPANGFAAPGRSFLAGARLTF